MRYDREIGQQALNQITISSELSEKFDFTINKEGSLVISEKTENTKAGAAPEKE